MHEAAVCQKCGAWLRFETDGNGRLVEICKCNPKGQRRFLKTERTVTLDELPTIIRADRAERGMTVAAYAAFLHGSKTMVKNLEKGGSQLRAPTPAKLRDHLGLLIEGVKLNGHRPAQRQQARAKKSRPARRPAPKREPPSRRQAYLEELTEQRDHLTQLIALIETA